MEKSDVFFSLLASNVVILNLESCKQHDNCFFIQHDWCWWAARTHH